MATKASSKIFPRAQEITFLLLRVVAGLLFLQAGGLKLFDWFGGIPAQFGGHPKLLSQTWIGGVLEFYGGSAILLGLWTRPIAFVLSGEMAVAYFQFHFPQSFYPTVSNGVPAVLYCFLFLYLAVAGGGAWSLDSVISRRAR